MKLTFKKVFYWSLGGHVGFLLLMCIVSLVVSCSQKPKTALHVFTLHTAPPSETVTVAAPRQEPAPVKKPQPPVTEKKTPPKKVDPKKEESKPKPTQSYAEFLKNNPIKEPKKEVSEQPVPVKPVEDPLANVRKELNAMLRDASQDTDSSNLKALHSYIGQLRNQLNVLWEQPENLAPGEWLAHVEFTVSANGRISGIRFVKRSDNPTFDDSIIRAMNQFQTASPPPDRKTHTFEIPFRMLVR